MTEELNKTTEELNETTKIKESVILSNIEDVLEEGKFNFNILKYKHTKKDENFAIKLPFSQEMITETLKNVKMMNSEEVSLIPYDPLHENKPNEYQYLALNKIQHKFQEVLKLLAEVKVLNKKSEYDAGSINLLLSDFDFKDKKYYLGSLQIPANRLLKGKRAYEIDDNNDCYDAFEVGKKPLFEEEAKLKKIELGNFIAIKFNTDFIVEISDEDAMIYIFNRKNFDSVFNYTEDLKNLVSNNTETIKSWTFLENTQYILDKISAKYVYEPLSKIISDERYLDSIKKIDNAELKNRLLSKSNNAFIEADFEEDKLKVTKANSKKIIKMISKGFKYNFFQDIGEE